MHPFAHFLADRLGFGRDLEIDRHGISSRLFLKWHISETRQRQRQTKFDVPFVIPRACEVSSMPRRLLSTAVLVFTGSSAGARHQAALALTRWADDDVRVNDARSRRPVSRLSIEMDQHRFGPHLR